MATSTEVTHILSDEETGATLLFSRFVDSENADDRWRLGPRGDQGEAIYTSSADILRFCELIRASVETDDH